MFFLVHNCVLSFAVACADPFAHSISDAAVTGPAPPGSFICWLPKAERHGSFAIRMDERTGSLVSLASVWCTTAQERTDGDSHLDERVQSGMRDLGLTVAHSPTLLSVLCPLHTRTLSRTLHLQSSAAMSSLLAAHMQPPPVRSEAEEIMARLDVTLVSGKGQVDDTQRRRQTDAARSSADHRDRTLHRHSLAQ